MAAGKRAYPGRHPDTVIFHRVHSAIEEVSTVHDPVTKHFILADSDEQEYTRCVRCIVLLDSDCVPVTLFEVEDLWQKAQRLRPHGPPCEAATISCAGEMNLDSLGQADGPLSPIEQGVILVTEHNAELNAGFVVLLGSNHAPPLLEDDWQNIPLGQGDKQEQAFANYQQALPPIGKTPCCDSVGVLWPMGGGAKKIP